MKKRKIFLGLFLAATAAVTLASCSKEKEDKKDTKTVETSADVSTSTETSTSTTTSAQTSTSTETATSTVETYTVTYHSDHGTLPQPLTGVTKLPDPLPILTDSDYDFIGWSETEGGIETVDDGMTISSNVDLYAVWALKTYL